MAGTICFLHCERRCIAADFGRLLEGQRQVVPYLACGPQKAWDGYQERKDVAEMLIRSLYLRTRCRLECFAFVMDLCVSWLGRGRYDLLAPVGLGSRPEAPCCYVAIAAGLPVLCDTLRGALFPAVIVRRVQCILYTNSTLVLAPG